MACTKEQEGIVPIADHQSNHDGNSIMQLLLLLSLLSSGYFLFLVNGFLGVETDGMSHISPGYIGDSKWHHFAFTIDRDKERNDNSLPKICHLYIDDVKVLKFDHYNGHSSQRENSDLKIGFTENTEYCMDQSVFVSNETLVYAAATLSQRILQNGSNSSSPKTSSLLLPVSRFICPTKEILMSSQLICLLLALMSSVNTNVVDWVQLALVPQVSWMKLETVTSFQVRKRKERTK